MGTAILSAASVVVGTILGWGLGELSGLFERRRARATARAAIYERVHAACVDIAHAVTATAGGDSDGSPTKEPVGRLMVLEPLIDDTELQDLQPEFRRLSFVYAADDRQLQENFETWRESWQAVASRLAAVRSEL